MIFSVQDLTFQLGRHLLEGWGALAARGVCALALFGAGWLLRCYLRARLFPKLLARTWKLPAVPILLRSFAVPTQRAAWITGLYLALLSLPWVSSAVPAFLTTVYQIAFTFCLCESFYRASDLAELLLASLSVEIRSNKTLVSLLNKAYKVVVVVIGVATIAQESGLPVGSIVAGAGLVGLTVSLAAQDTASNLFSGLVILLERPFVLGDWIKIGDVEGEVIDINFRSTKIRTADNSVYILTNSNVSSSTINNGTQRTKRLYRFTFSVPFSTSRTQLEALMADLTGLLKTSPYTYEDSVFVKINSFAASGVELILSAYLQTPDYIRFLEMQTELNLDVMDVMKKNGVDFALSSTTVYLAPNDVKPRT